MSYYGILFVFMIVQLTLHSKVEFVAGSFALAVHHRADISAGALSRYLLEN
jgi:hypothetical protein